MSAAFSLRNWLHGNLEGNAEKIAVTDFSWYLKGKSSVTFYLTDVDHTSVQKGSCPLNVIPVVESLCSWLPAS